MTGGIEDFFVHQVTVETFQGAGATGPVYAAAVQVTCFVDSSTKLIRDGTGEQVVSSTKVYMAVSDAALFTPDSRVTEAKPLYPGDSLYPANGLFLPPDRTAQVITTNALDAPGLGLPEHAVAYLT